MMNQLEEFNKRQHHITPPPGAAADVERAVMSAVLTERPTLQLFRKRLTYAALGIALAGLVGFNLLSRSPVQEPAPETYFIASKIILDDHVSIWLEPVDASTVNRRAE